MSIQDSAYYLTADASGNINVSPGAVNTSRLWGIQNGERGRKIISCNTGTVLATATTAPTNGNYLVCTTYTANNDFKDEWSITKIPTSGYEVAYQPELWNDIVSVKSTTNCYAYALNCQVIENNSNYLAGHSYYNTYMQPGQSDNKSLMPEDYTESGNTIVDYVVVDSLAYGFTFKPIDKNAICDSGCYKVALVIDYYDDLSTVIYNIEGEYIYFYPDLDYHWYRQNPNGTWSHKPGGTEVTNLDASGKIIYDPDTADRNYVNHIPELSQFDPNWQYAGIDYAAFIGYYQVTPIGNIGVR